MDNTQTLNDPIIIIGSGAAGVSAAWPLVQAGYPVIMVDAGKHHVAVAKTQLSFLETRQSDADQQSLFLGQHFSSVNADKNTSPKLRSPYYQPLFSGYNEHYRIHSENFRTVGALAVGGLANAWGGVCYTFNKNEFVNDAAAYNELKISYKNIAKRIGMSGPQFDDLSPHFSSEIPLQKALALHPLFQSMLDKYKKHNLPDFRLGQPRSAVITEHFDNRLACDLSNMCLWGCKRLSIYNPVFEIEKLKKFKHFTLIEQTLVDNITRSVNGYHVQVRHSVSQQTSQLSAKTIMLAAGTIGSSILALKLTKSYHQPLRLQSNPGFAIGFIAPSRLGYPVSPSAFGMGQLAFTLQNKAMDEYAVGTLYSAEVLRANEIIQHFPFTRPGAIKLNKTIAPATLLTNCFFPGKYSDNQITVNPTHDTHIRGGHTASYQPYLRATIKLLKRQLKRLSAYPLPLSCKPLTPGTDIHYAATLPMSNQAQPLTVNTHGQLFAHPNLYIVDGSVLPVLPAKNLSFTIMANADRIARQFVKANAKVSKMTQTEPA